jgi:hypothetical protein
LFQLGLCAVGLNGSEIPAQLPPELVPPSARDLDNSVDFLKRILENESRSRSPSSLDAPVSKLKGRSFNSTSAPGAGGRQDATVYKHEDYEPAGGFYTPASRRVDRDTVRSRNDEDSPAADLLDMKRQLENTAKMLDRAAEADASRTAEDEALDREMQDLRYRVNRVQEDLEYVSRGPRTAGKEEERRRLDRELLELMHKRLPEIERKIEDRERRREREKRQWEDARNKRNERHGRYDDRDDRYSTSVSSGQYSRERDDDRRYPRGPYSGDDRDGSFRRDRSRDGDYDRPRTPPARSPVPPPPPAASNLQPTASPRPTVSPAPNTKNMTPEERQAYLRAEAKRRIDARTQALGLTASVPSPVLDTTVEERLAREKKEAEEKARQAEKEAEDRERVRKERLEAAKALKEGKTDPATPTIVIGPTTPASTIQAKTIPGAKSRPPPPPLPRKAPTSRPSIVTQPPAPTAPPVLAARTQPTSSVAPKPPVAPPKPEIDPEEEKIRAREESLRKQREERAARLRQLEQEEEEARRAEEQYLARRQVLLNTKAQSPVNVTPPLRPVEEPVVSADPVPPPPPPQPSATFSPSIDKSSRNPFSRLMKDGGISVSANPSPPTNDQGPFPRSGPAAPAPPKSPTPVVVNTDYHTAPGDSDDEWDHIDEKVEDDSSDDEIRNSRDTRSKIAQQIFGTILPPARPQSAGVVSPTRSTSSGTAAFPPPVPSAPSIPSAAVLSTPVAPVAPAPPVAPPAAPPAPIAAAPPPGDVSALMRSIQGGLKLKKAQTVDRSAPAITGKVVGDQAPPPHINATPRPASPPRLLSEPQPASVPMSSNGSSTSSHRQSVDWYAGLAADQGAANHLPSMTEEDEQEVGGHEGNHAPIPQIQVEQHVVEADDDLLADVDRSVGMCPIFYYYTDR